jgi:hypothetical protein
MRSGSPSVKKKNGKSTKSRQDKDVEEQEVEKEGRKFKKQK